jgi:hypothetical protein
MHPIPAGFITAACHHPAVGSATDNDRLANEGTVHQPLYRYKKGIQVEMHYLPVIITHDHAVK